MLAWPCLRPPVKWWRLRCPIGWRIELGVMKKPIFGACLVIAFLAALPWRTSASDKLRVIIETDAGGDPDDEQSLVRFLLYTNEFDVEGIICTLARARDRENLNPERTGLGIVRRQLKAYGECRPNLVKHDRRYPTLDYLWQRTVAGYDGDAGVKRI